MIDNPLLERAVAALRDLYETSGRVPLAPSQTDDATLLAFIAARRKAKVFLARHEKQGSEACEHHHPNPSETCPACGAS